jgi:hypothetical protein
MQLRRCCRSKACFWLLLVLSSWEVESFSSPSSRVRQRSSHFLRVGKLMQRSKTGRSGYVPAFSRRMLPLLAETTTAASEAELAEQQYDPNSFVPETKSITGSMQFYAKFVINSFVMNRLKKSKQLTRKKRGDGRKSFLENLAKLNEQRKNLVSLAGYNSSIVIPSFAYLFMGALLTSIVPLYEAKCIQLVATLHPSRQKVVEALVGLVAYSTLASLFTGLRGSLFWLAGTSSVIKVAF